MKRILLILLTSLTVACSPPMTVPIQKTDFRTAEKQSKHLIVLLSGRSAPASYFQDHQWVDLARKYHVDADFIAPYAHFGYYMAEQLVPRLNEDVIKPAKKQGYETISLAGISMGGLGTILYSESFPEDVDRIYLIAPYLADEDIHNEIRAAGGLPSWQIKPENREDWEYFLWDRLKKITQGDKVKDRIYLGYGDKDQLKGHGLLAKNIPPQHVLKIPGEHKDVTFKRVWEMMIKKGFLDSRASVVAR